MKQGIIILLTFCLSLTAAAQTTDDYRAAIAAQGLPEPGCTHNRITNFEANNPRLSDHLWVEHLMENGSLFDTHELFTASAQQAGSADNILNVLQNITDDPTIFVGLCMTGETAYRGPERVRFETYNRLSKAQDFLNLIYLYGPGLRELMVNEQYDEAFTYARQNNITNVIITSIGIQAIGVPAMTLNQMIEFYRAGVRQLLPISFQLPYRHPRIWHSNFDNIDTRATNNFNNPEYNQFPNFAWYNSYDSSPDNGNWFTDLVRTALPMIVVAAITFGVASGVGAIVGNVAGTTTVTATSATTGVSTATTYVGGVATGSVSVSATGAVIGSSTTIAGTALSVATNATAGALVGSLTSDQSFGDALVSGLVGGAVGSAVGAAANSIGPNGLASTIANNTPLNEAAAGYVAATAIGTGTNAALNGGDLDAAFQGAATSAAIGVLQRNAGRLFNRTPAAERCFGAACLTPEEAQAAAESRMAQDNDNSLDTIVNGSPESGGGLNFNIPTQNNTRWDDLNDSFNQNQDRGIASRGQADLERGQRVGDLNNDNQNRLADNQARMDSRDPVPQFSSTDVTPNTGGVNVQGGGLVIGPRPSPLPGPIIVPRQPLIDGIADNRGENVAGHFLGRAWSSTLGRIIPVLRGVPGFSGTTWRNMSNQEGTTLAGVMVAAEVADRYGDVFRNGGYLVAEAPTGAGAVSTYGRNVIRFVGGGPVQAFALTSVLMTDYNLDRAIEFTANNPDIADRFNPYLCGACGL